MPATILVLYYSRTGHTARLARLIARGVEEIPGMQARLRQVPPVAPVTDTAQPPEPEGGGPYAPPQDPGAPDAAETDPVALNSAEDLDEDRLRVDPLEEGMDPPEHWSGVTKYGMTPWEQAHPRPLGERLAEERPDPAAEEATEEDAAVQEYAEDTGISADIAGGSMAAEIREPPA